MRRLSPEASFIPEIWQGHKNQGEGAWRALERLEQHGR
jgi:N-acetylneuraminate synthase